MSETELETAVTEQSRDRRARAVELSGWGERFTVVQPHNLSFWVFIAMTVTGVVGARNYLAPGAGLYAGGFVVGAVLCALCGLAWFAWFRHIDRWERQPGMLVFAAIVWGALPATFAIALPVNNAMISLYTKTFGQEWASLWAPGFTAPITEELAKVCGFLLLMSLAPRLIRTPNDGLIVGAFIGLGFAIFEDFVYAANATAGEFGTNPVGNAVSMSFTRIAVSFASHPLFSALVCSGVLYLVGTRTQPRRIDLGVAFVLAGMVLHFTWDDATALGGGGVLVFGVMLLSIVVGFTILTLAFRRAAPREHDFVRDILAPEVDAGTLTADEVEGILDRRARKAYRSAAPHRRARRARKHLRRAILDLTHDIARDDGADTDAVRHSRAEVDRIRAATV